MEKIYSLDKHYWCDNDEIMDRLISEKEYYEKIYMGDKVMLEHKDIINTEYILGQMQDYAYDLNEYAETYLEDVTKEQKEELNLLLLDWFNKNIRQPNCFSVINIETISTKDL